LGRKVFKKTIGIIMGFAILILQSPVFVSANNQVQKTIRVGYYENEIFQEGAGAGQVKSGYAYEFYMKLSEYTGWRYEYVYGSYNDLYEKLVAGDIDVLAGIAYREDRKEEIAYPDLPMGTESYVLVKHDFDDDITADPTTLKGHTIGVLDSNMSFTLDKYLNEHEIDANVVLFDNTAKLLASFDSDEIDILAAESDGTNIRQHAEVLLAYATTDYYICVDKEDSLLLKELNEALNSLFIDEPYYLSSLNSKYFSSSLSVQTFSDRERKWLDAHDSLVIGYLNNYLPYSDTDDNGKVTGIVKDIVPKIINSLKIDSLKISYVGFDNYDDMVAAVDSEEVDIAFPVAGGYYYSEENGIFQTNTILSSTTDLIYKDVVINPDLATIAVNSNNKMQYYYVKSNYPNANMVFYDGIEECLKAVLDGKADCTTLNGLRANTILRNREYRDLSLRQLSYTDDRCMGIKIGNEGLLRIFNRGIHILGREYAENQAYKYVEGLYTDVRGFNILDYVYIVAIVLILLLCTFIALLVLRIKKYSLLIEKVRSDYTSKTEFIDNMAVNIRQPIAEIAEETESTTANRLLSTVDNIIDLNLFETGKVTLKEDTINIINLLKNVENNVRNSSEKKDINIEFGTSKVTNKLIIADEQRLTQILTAILSNAVKYSSKGSHVSCEIEELRCNNPSITNMVFTITDSGKGFSQEFQKRIFEAYAKEDSQGNSGAGLGLTLVKQIVDLMGGEIDVTSVKDKGSKFVVKVPVKIYFGIR
jgi:signal transduction histidine kinase